MSYKFTIIIIVGTAYLVVTWYLIISLLFCKIWEQTCVQVLMMANLCIHNDRTLYSKLIERQAIYKLFSINFNPSNSKPKCKLDYLNTALYHPPLLLLFIWMNNYGVSTSQIIILLQFSSVFAFVFHNIMIWIILHNYIIMYFHHAIIWGK